MTYAPAKPGGCHLPWSHMSPPLLITCLLPPPLQGLSVGAHYSLHALLLPCLLTLPCTLQFTASLQVLRKVAPDPNNPVALIPDV